MSKLRQTEIDYAVVAVNPALIMVLVGSLVYFLLTLLYQGPFDGRLQFIFGLFVFSIVLISRISIEEGWQRAGLFAFLLGAAVLMAVMRFVPEAVTATIILLGVIWWCANRLTYDCTVVEESEDASNQGLIQANEEHSGTTDSATVEDAVEQQTTLSWLADMINPTSTHHAPGMWVVYFSLAALPLFGIGQAFSPAGTEGNRLYLFWLLLAYVAAALCLLVSTSFLGLRRYLRQRGIEMPLSMTGTWLGTGLVVVVIVLAVISIIPRPNAEYQLAQLPQLAEEEPEQKSNQHSVGSEGADDKNKDARQTEGEKRDSQENGEKQSSSKKSDQTEENSGTDENGQKKKSGQGKTEDKNSKSTSPSEKGDEQGEGDSQEKSDNNENDSQSNKQSDQGKQQNNQNSEDSNQSENQQNSESEQNKSENQKQESNEKAEQQPKSEQSEQNESTQEQAAEQPQPSSSMSDMFQSMGDFLKFIFYCIVAIGILVFLWIYREKVMAALAAFIKELQDFWNKLFGISSEEETDAVTTTPQAIQPKPFAAFHNPFTSGQAKSWSLEKLVRYSFQATEAWAFEKGLPRDQEQTPLEFARQLEKHFEQFGKAAKELADHYGQVAYGSGKASQEAVQCIKKVWKNLT